MSPRPSSPPASGGHASRRRSRHLPPTARPRRQGGPPRPRRPRPGDAVTGERRPGRRGRGRSRRQHGRARDHAALPGAQPLGRTGDAEGRPGFSSPRCRRPSSQAPATGHRPPATGSPAHRRFPAPRRMVQARGGSDRRASDVSEHEARSRRASVGSRAQRSARPEAASSVPPPRRAPIRQRRCRRPAAPPAAPRQEARAGLRSSPAPATPPAGCCRLRSLPRARVGRHYAWSQRTSRQASTATLARSEARRQVAAEPRRRAGGRGGHRRAARGSPPRQAPRSHRAKRDTRPSSSPARGPRVRARGLADAAAETRRRHAGAQPAASDAPTAPQGAPAPAPPPAQGGGGGGGGGDIEEIYTQVIERLRRDLLADRERMGDLLGDLP